MFYTNFLNTFSPKKMIARLSIATMAIVLSFQAQAVVIATIDTPNTLNDSDAWTIFNDSSQAIQQIVLTATSPVDFDPRDFYGIDASSDVMGVSLTGSMPSSPFDYFVITLDFTDFFAGTNFIFGLDTDRHNFSADGLDGAVNIAVQFADNTVADAVFRAIGPSNPDAVQAVIGTIPEPAPLAILLIGIAGIVGLRKAKTS